eukprot:jgi/Hompol1/5605/HPOL_001225-RA
MQQTTQTSGRYLASKASYTSLNATKELEAKYAMVPETFGFLFGATANGHLLVYGKGGMIVDRYQLHLGPIQQLICDPDRHLIISVAKDEAIRISRVYPLDENIVQIQIAIQVNFVPRMICVMGNLICVSSEDATIHMFEFNLERNDLPPTYLKSIQAQSAKDFKPEQPLAFDDVLIPFTRPPKKLAKSRRVHIDKNDPFSVLNAINLHNFDALESDLVDEDIMHTTSIARDTDSSDRSAAVGAETTASKSNGRDVSDSFRVATQAIDDILDALGEKYRVHAKAMQDQERGRIDFDGDNMVRIDMDTDAAKLSRVKSIQTIGRLGKGVSSKAVLNEQQSASAQHLDELSSNIPESESIHDLNKSIAQLTQSEAFDSELHLKEHLMIAPDGRVPNSGIIDLVNSWLRIHDRMPLSTDAARSYKKKKSKVTDHKDDDKRLRSEQYKAKLKDLMMQMQQQELDAASAAAAGELEGQDAEDGMGGDTNGNGVPQFEDDDEDEESQIRNRMRRRMMDAQEIVQQTLEVRLPPVIEKMMDFAWFPDEDVCVQPNQ